MMRLGQNPNYIDEETGICQLLPWYCCSDLLKALAGFSFSLKQLRGIGLAQRGDGFYTHGSVRSLVTMESVPLGIGRREASR